MELLKTHIENAQLEPGVSLSFESDIGGEYASFLREVLDGAIRFGAADAALLRRIEVQTERLLLAPARAFEAVNSPASVLEAQKRCRQWLRPIWERGPLGREITHWPDGPGSSTAMELIYRNEAPCHDLGVHYSEWFLLTRDLAHAVRSRRNLLRDVLTHEVNARAGSLRLLDVACGPCQSLREALPRLDDPTRLRLEGLDTDELQQMRNAAFFQKRWGLDSSFPVKNALRADYRPESYDIVYSTGLYDYLGDSSLVRLWQRTFAALKPGGVALLSMKDQDRYCPAFYHWAIEWNQFRQRSASDVLVLATKAGLPVDRVLRDATGIIMLLVVRKAG